MASYWWRPRWLIIWDFPPLGIFAPLQFLQNSLQQPLSSEAYQAVYYSRFVTVLVIGLLAIAWLLSGMKGLYRLAGEARFFWLMSLMALVVWINLSAGWATQSSAVAQSQAMQWNLTVVFIFIISALRPPHHWVIYALCAGMLLQSFIAIGQVAVQSEIGVRLIDDNYLKIGLGLVEFNLEPDVSGANIIQSRGVRFLRAHGLTPHPNLLALSVVMSLVTSLSLWKNRTKQPWLMGLTVVGLWTLFLTFSRASIAGFGIGVAIYFGLSWLNRDLPREKWSLVGRYLAVVGLVALVFVSIYWNLLQTRAGVAEEGFEATVETRSVVDRQIYLEQAHDIMQDHRWQGIGIGNFVRESHERLLNDPRDMDLSGSNVHNIYFLALSEIGLVGGLLLLVNAGLAATLIFYYWRNQQLISHQISLLAGLGAWLAIGWFEFAQWALFTHQLVFWSVLALALAPPEIHEPDLNRDLAVE